VGTATEPRPTPYAVGKPTTSRLVASKQAAREADSAGQSILQYGAGRSLKVQRWARYTHLDFHMTINSIDSAEEALAQPEVIEAIHRGIMSFKDSRVTYQLHNQRSEDWNDPEEWVRACSIAWLVIDRGYPANRLKTEVTVPRRTPSDLADIVVYVDDACREPYLVVENKASGQSGRDRLQAVEQLFGNANSLRAALGLYDEGTQSAFYDVAIIPHRNDKQISWGTEPHFPPNTDKFRSMLTLLANRVISSP